ncbi:MAG TPA: hypothetical protein VFG83_07055, partial [Kofleriaceae bacterium]|nr:hypothetical protein [Kofleriaceae bacterium]
IVPPVKVGLSAIALLSLLGGCAVGGAVADDLPDAGLITAADGPSASRDGPARKSDGPTGKVDGPIGNIDGPVGKIDAAPSPVDAALPTDAPPPDAPPPPKECSATFTNLLANASFDQGAGIAWTATGSNIIVPGSASFPAGDGSHFAWLAGFDGADDTLAQTVRIPSGTTELRLRFLRCNNQEAGANGTDQMTVELRATSGTLLDSLATFTDTTSGCGWQAFPTIAISPTRAGQTVTLAFAATTDDNGVFTSYRVDEVALEAACP